MQSVRLLLARHVGRKQHPDVAVAIDLPQMDLVEGDECNAAQRLS